MIRLVAISKLENYCIMVINVFWSEYFVETVNKSFKQKKLLKNEKLKFKMFNMQNKSNTDTKMLIVSY